jgi:hypothetical protein
LIYWEDEECVSVVNLTKLKSAPIVGREAKVKIGAKVYNGLVTALGTKDEVSAAESRYLDGEFAIPVPRRPLGEIQNVQTPKVVPKRKLAGKVIPAKKSRPAEPTGTIICVTALDEDCEDLPSPEDTPMKNNTEKKLTGTEDTLMKSNTEKNVTGTEDTPMKSNMDKNLTRIENTLMKNNTELNLTRTEDTMMNRIMEDSIYLDDFNDPSLPPAACQCNTIVEMLMTMQTTLDRLCNRIEQLEARILNTVSDRMR